MQTRLKPMTARDVLDVTFTILRERFWTFQGVTFFAFLPTMIVFLIGMLFLGLVIFGLPRGLQFTNPDYGTILFERMGLAGMLFLFSLTGVGLILIVAGVLLNLHGTIRIFHYGLHQEKCSIRQAFTGFKKQWLRYFIFFILTWIGGCIAFIPGIILTAVVTVSGSAMLRALTSILTNLVQLTITYPFCLAPLVIVLEKDTNVIKAFIRAFTLLKGHRWRILGTLILTYLLGYTLVIIIFMIVACSVFFVMHQFGLITAALSFIMLPAILYLAIIMVSYYLGTLTAIYYDLIIRKEGYDLQVQLNQPLEVANTLPTTNERSLPS